MPIFPSLPNPAREPRTGLAVFAASPRLCKKRSLTALFALLACLSLAWPNVPAPVQAAAAAAPDAPGATAPATAPAAATPADVSGAADDIVPAKLETALYRLPQGDPSGRVLAVLTLVSAPGWHAYAVGPAESGQSAQATLTAGNTPAVALFPPGTPTPDALEPDKTVLVYEGKTPIFVPVTDAMLAAPALTGRLRVFSCSPKSCWPSSLEVNIPLGAANDPAGLPLAESAPWWPLFSALRSAALAMPAAVCPEPAHPLLPRHEPRTTPGEEAAPAAPSPTETAASIVKDLTPRSFTPALEVSGLVKAASLAFLAGFILNFMPCVLPVVSLKLSGLLAVSGEEGKVERRRILREHNLFFALGILSYFLILSVLLGGLGLAWGEMFQSPSLAIVVTVVLFLLCLSLFGVFHLPVVDLKISSGGRGHTRRGAFLTGMLTTLLATPCSGPFLGGVLAWTLLQPLPVVMTVFSAIGLGMASPYGMLAIWPRLVRFLPRPGVWMQGLEKAMAFILAATCLYFLALLPPQRLLPALVALWAAGVGAYLYGHGAHLAHGPARRAAMTAAALVVAAAGLAFALTYAPRDDADWLGYTPQAFAERLGKDNLVVDFTADWCPTCKLLERTVLTPARVSQWAARGKAVFMRVDLTRQTPQAMALLKALGSQSIPVVGFFPAGEAAKSPVVLRDLFTAGQFEQALDEAFGRAAPPAKKP